MADEDKKLDPYKPSQPRVPGVSNHSGDKKPETPANPVEALRSLLKSRMDSVQMPPLWVTLTLAGALIIGIGFAWWNHGTSAEETPPPTSSALPGAGEFARATQILPVAPGEVATTTDLEKPWSSKRFLFRDPLTSVKTPAIVVRLPGGDYWGFSLREPYGTCELEWVTDLEKLEADYQLRADHPMVGDPCNRSVFDLLRYGGGPNGLVRGEIVRGAAVRPPVAIEIRTRGNQILAVRME
jgi:hypothetical protein